MKSGAECIRMAVVISTRTADFARDETRGCMQVGAVDKGKQLADLVMRDPGTL